MPSQVNQDSLIRKIMKENGMTIVWVTGVVFSFIMFVVIPQQETKTNIALIQQSIKKIEENHLTHLQDYAEEIKEVKQEQKELDEEQIKLMKSIERILTILETK